MTAQMKFPDCQPMPFWLQSTVCVLGVQTELRHLQIPKLCCHTCYKKNGTDWL